MMSGTKFKDMASGASHSLAIDEEGNLYTWGITNVTEWYWGYPFEYDIDFEPRLIMSGTKFKSVAAGDNHSSAIDVNGNLYTWGKNDSKQLGRITDYEDDYTPEKITSSVLFDKVIAGGESNFAFTIEGDLYIWGQRTSSNFGDVPYEDRNVPDLYANGKNYNKVVVGFDHSLIIDKNNDLYAWGSNYWGQLGDGTETDRSTPILIKSGTKFKDISAGNDHSLAVDINNNIYAWGFNDNGQLGDGTTTIRKSPVLINLN